MPRMYPVKNRIKVAGHIPYSGADSNAKYGRHAGDDSANGVGTDVYAPTDGVVTPYKWSNAHGHVVEIFDGTHYPHVFHLSQRLVNDGQRVTAGQLVAKSGNTGLSTGPHIHFGVSKKSVANVTSFNDFIDPMEWLTQGEEMLNETTLTQLWAGYADQYPAPESFIEYWTGKPLTECLDWLIAQDIHVEIIRKYRDYDRVFDTAEGRLRSIEALIKELDVASNGYEKVTEPLYRRKST